MFHTCDRCDSPASFHLTDIKDGQKSERHLCEECAKSLQVPQANKELQNLLKSFDPNQVGQQDQKASSKSCPECGMTYAEFRQNGRFGCPRDYDVFGAEVIALLERIHGASKYSGKTPEGGRVLDGVLLDAASEVRDQLSTAIEEEDYELAARLRDEIRKIADEGSSSQAGGASEAR